MDIRSKQMVVNALIKVVNSAPGSYYQGNGLYPQGYQNRDVSMQEFSTWINYANQVLDISFNHIGLNAILTAKLTINQLGSQYGISNKQRIEQVKQVLFQLAQVVTQY